MGAVIGLRPEDLPAAIERGEIEVRRAVAAGALAGAHRGRALIVKRTPVDMGPLKASWKVRPGATEFAGLETILAQLINDAPYIALVEIGTRPHKVNPEAWLAIYEWVRRHFRGGELGGTGRMRRQQRTPESDSRPWHGPDPVISQITNAIVWRIRRKGSKPRWFIRDSIDELRAVMGYEVERAVRDAVDRINSGGGEP